MLYGSETSRNVYFYNKGAERSVYPLKGGFEEDCRRSAPC